MVIFITECAREFSILVLQSESTQCRPEPRGPGPVGAEYNNSPPPRTGSSRPQNQNQMCTSGQPASNQPRALPGHQSSNELAHSPPIHTHDWGIQGVQGVQDAQMRQVPNICLFTVWCKSAGGVACPQPQLKPGQTDLMTWHGGWWMMT